MTFTLFHLRTERVPPRQQFSFPIEKYGKLNKNNWKCRYRKSWFWYWIWCSYLFFWLDADCVRSFALMQKNQKIKIISVLFSWKKRTKSSRLRLLSYSVTSFRCARRKLAALRQRRSGRSTSFLRLTLTRTRPVQWTIENWQWRIIFFSLIYSWNLPGDCRGAALLRLITTLYIFK